MDPLPSYRPRISRETRLLLTAALVAASALWALARLRFPDLPATPNAVAPLLSPLAAPASLDSLASEVSQLQRRLGAALVSVQISDGATDHSGADTSRTPGVRLRDDLAVIVVAGEPSESVRRHSRVIAIDPASGLAVVRVAGGAAVPPLTPWVPSRLDRPQYVMVAHALAARIALRPVFVDALEPVATALWPDAIWRVGRSSDLPLGSFIFTTAGEFVGAVIDYGSRPAIVPAGVLLGHAERLLARPIVPAGDLGVRVQALTADVADATGATSGAVVTWVDQRGPASQVLAVGDVIEALDGQSVPTFDHWRVRMARLNAGDVLTLRVRRHGGLQDLSLEIPTAPAPVSANERLGLRLQRASGVGARVIGVEPGSVAARAALTRGDIVTMIGDVSAPTPEQVRAVFSQAPRGKPILAAVTRGPAHFVTTFTR